MVAIGAVQLGLRRQARCTQMHMSTGGSRLEYSAIGARRQAWWLYRIELSIYCTRLPPRPPLLQRACFWKPSAILPLRDYCCPKALRKNTELVVWPVVVCQMRGTIPRQTERDAVPRGFGFRPVQERYNTLHLSKFISHSHRYQEDGGGDSGKTLLSLGCAVSTVAGPKWL